ncbi:MAG: EamA family transporter, partial [Proteobacteria bacterium]|nr:EamA family transporter [Pseudomonadota bacterium]
VFWYFGSHKVDGIMASLSTAVMPVLTVIIAWITLGEVIGLAQFIGMFFVISSVVLYSLPQNFRFKKLKE